MSVAIIPARGGSKRIPKKNIRNFCGKPMIAWPIEAALKSGVFDRVIVSTDDSIIADIAVCFGAVVPDLRPAALADDYTPVGEVIRNSIEAFNIITTDICLVYATAAGLLPEDFKCGKTAISSGKTDFVMGLVEYSHPIQRAVELKNDFVKMKHPENANMRTQDLSSHYHDAAQFVFGRRQAWLAGQNVWTASTSGIVMDSFRAFDIDTPEDWERAEGLFEHQLRKAKAV